MPRPTSTRRSWCATTPTSTRPAPTRRGYHLTPDLVDQSIRFIADHIAGAPQTPWLTWLALGACHAPHQAPRDLILKYDALFQHGWDVERERRLARQKRDGRRARRHELPPRNDGVVAWDSAGRGRAQGVLPPAGRLRGDARPCRPAPRAADGVPRDLRQADNTLVLVLSDNGASQEGFIWGMVNAMGPYNAIAGADAGEARAHRRHRRAELALQFSARLGDGVQHAAEALQAEHARRRHPRSAGDLAGRRACPRAASCATSSATPATSRRRCST